MASSILTLKSSGAAPGPSTDTIACLQQVGREQAPRYDSQSVQASSFSHAWARSAAIGQV